MIARRALEWIRMFKGPAGLKFFRYLLDKFFKRSTLTTMHVYVLFHSVC